MLRTGQKRNPRGGFPAPLGLATVPATLELTRSWDWIVGFFLGGKKGVGLISSQKIADGNRLGWLGNYSGACST